MTLDVYEASKIRTNKNFTSQNMPEFEKLYLPETMRPFFFQSPTGTKDFIVDDNRSVVDSRPCTTVDGTDFYLSVKGVGSTTAPFSRQPLGKAEVCSILKDSQIRERIISSKEQAPRYLSGELWSRGSPYGAQGMEYADIAMRASEMAGTTSIHGFRIAPIVKILSLPDSLQQQTKKLYWYRRFDLQMVQEARLVPSNIRIYFHSDYTIGNDTCTVFDMFGIDTNEKATKFLINFLKSGMAVLTLFPRSMSYADNKTTRLFKKMLRRDSTFYHGMDFYDVWLDKDAILAPDGTIFFADLEGIVKITVPEKEIEEKMDYQIYRSLYEMIYAYEQIERERVKRFGYPQDRKIQFENLLQEALLHDEILTLERRGQTLQLMIGNILNETKLNKQFKMLDFD